MLNESAVRPNHGQFVPIMDSNPGNRARVEHDGFAVAAGRRKRWVTVPSFTLSFQTAQF